MHGIKLLVDMNPVQTYILLAEIMHGPSMLSLVIISTVWQSKVEAEYNLNKKTYHKSLVLASFAVSNISMSEKVIVSKREHSISNFINF